MGIHHSLGDLRHGDGTPLCEPRPATPEESAQHLLEARHRLAIPAYEKREREPLGIGLAILMAVALIVAAAMVVGPLMVMRGLWFW